MKFIKSLLFLVLLNACAPFPELPPDISDATLSEEDAIASDESLDNGAPTDSQTPVDNTAPNNNPGTASGNVSEAVEPEPMIKQIDPKGLVLNEIYYDVPGSDTDGLLFVELFASSAGSLEDYTIRFINGNNGKVTDIIDLPIDAEIGEEDFYVIADGRTGALETTQVENYDFIDNFDPQNGPDGVQLLNREGALVDTLVYGDGSFNLSDDGLALGEGLPAPDSQSGFSISRLIPGVDTDNNEADFVINEVPSPGSGIVVEPQL